MGKGLGIAALVLSILAIFVPVVSIFVVCLAMLLCAFAAVLGERPFSISSWLISAINLFFLSPFIWVGFATDRLQGKSSWKLIVGVVLLVPLVAIIVGFFISRAKRTALPANPHKVPYAPDELIQASDGNKSLSASSLPPTNTASASAVSGVRYRPCPFCAEPIRAEAKKCRFCGSAVDPTEIVKETESPDLPARMNIASQALSAPPVTLSTLPLAEKLIKSPEVDLVGSATVPIQSSVPVAPLAPPRSVGSKQIMLGALAAIVVAGVGAILHFKTPKFEPAVVVAPTLNPAPTVTPTAPPPAQSSTAPQIDASSQGVLNPRWYASWIDRKGGERLTASSVKFGDCHWIANVNEIPKRSGCWAHYGQSQTLSEIIGTGRAVINSETAAIAQTVSPIDRYRVVKFARRDEGGEDIVSDCEVIYFYDRERVLSRTWCQNDQNQRVNLVVFENSSTPVTGVPKVTVAMPVYLTDEFNGTSLDTSKWSVKGNRVVVQNGYVSMLAAQTDNTGQMWTNSLPPLSKVRLTMRHWMQPGGSQPFFPMVQLRDSAQQNIVDLRWLRSSDASAHCNVQSNYDKPLIHISGTMCVAVATTSASEFYGKWVDTLITYDVTTGQYGATSTAPGAVMQLKYVLPPQLRSKVKDVYLSGYGWFTGHEHKMDAIRIEGQL